MSDSTRAEVAVPSGTVKQQRVAVAAGDQVGWHIAERDGHSIDFSAMFVRGETVLGVVEETRCASHSGQHVCEQSGELVLGVDREVLGTMDLHHDPTT